MTWATPERRLRLTWELVLISFLALFAELMVIRWLASEVRVFAYFKNLPLMAAFLGLGLGCARWRSSWRVFPWFPVLFVFLCLVPAYAERLDLVRLRFPDTSVFLWSTDAALPLLQGAKFVGIILVIFFLVVAAFTALGEKIGELFDAFPPLTAYSINVAASLLGILVFSVIAFAEWPPVVWVAIVAVLSLWFFRRLLAAACLLATVALVAWAAPATH